MTKPAKARSRPRGKAASAQAQPRGAGKPAIKVKPYSYQPSKAELEADVSLPNVTPEKLARRLRNVQFVESNDANTT